MYFSKALLEGLIFGWAYLRRESCVSKSIGLALQLDVNLPFLLCFVLYLRAISKYKPLGGLHLEGRFNGGFFALRVWGGGLLFGGAYTQRGLFSEFYGKLKVMTSKKTEAQMHTKKEREEEKTLLLRYAEGSLK